MTLDPREARRVERAAEAARGERKPERLPRWAGRPTTSYVDVACRLRVALATLPDTPQGIALLLEAHMVRGYTMAADCCPLAQYLTVFVGHAINCGPDTVEADQPREWSIEVVTPHAVRMFIIGFDAGEYPSLAHPEN